MCVCVCVRVCVRVGVCVGASNINIWWVGVERGREMER